MWKRRSLSIMLLVASMVAFPLLGQSELAQDYRVPDQYLTLEHNIHSVGRMAKALRNFNALLENCHRLLSEEAYLKVMEGVSAAGKNVGFANWPLVVETMLRKQDFEIKKLQYELGKEKLELGKINRSELDQLERVYQEADREFMRFWNNHHLSD